MDLFPEQTERVSITLESECVFPAAHLSSEDNAGPIAEDCTPLFEQGGSGIRVVESDDVGAKDIQVREGSKLCLLSPA